MKVSKYEIVFLIILGLFTLLLAFLAVADRTSKMNRFDTGDDFVCSKILIVPQLLACTIQKIERSDPDMFWSAAWEFPTFETDIYMSEERNCELNINGVNQNIFVNDIIKINFKESNLDKPGRYCLEYK